MSPDATNDGFGLDQAARNAAQNAAAEAAARPAPLEPDFPWDVLPFPRLDVATEAEYLPTHAQK